MYFDTLTIASLQVFASAFGSFVYSSAVSGCITASNSHAQAEL